MNNQINKIGSLLNFALTNQTTTLSIIYTTWVVIAFLFFSYLLFKGMNLKDFQLKGKTTQANFVINKALAKIANKWNILIDSLAILFCLNMAFSRISNIK